MSKHKLDLNHSKACATCGTVFYRDKRCTWKWWNAARFCSRPCSSKEWSKIAQTKTPDLETAFYKSTIVSGKENCWKSTACVDKDGYPLISFQAKQFRANRVAIIISGRDLKENEQACHTCGNSWCVNPDHIYAGTAKQNTQDKVKHGTHLQGEKCHMAKLKADDILEIRNSNLKIKDLAKLYNVSHGNISMIKSGKTWRHVK